MASSPIDLKKITTEGRNKNTKNIYKLDSYGIAKMINKEDQYVAIAVKKELKNIGKAMDIGLNAIKAGGRMVYIGAGTSGRLGVLDASEMPPTFGISMNVIIGIIAGGDKALRQPIEGAEDSTTLIIEDLKKINFSKNDVLVGLSASGRTPYVIAGLKYAASLGAKSISISTSKDTAISKEATVGIEVVTGAEAITGSTRMKSGTAQKMVLNILSTGIMTQLGKVYENLMIDVKTTNEKLVERAISIVMELTSVSREVAMKALAESKNDVKCSIVMIKKNVSFKEAQSLVKTKLLKELI